MGLLIAAYRNYSKLIIFYRGFPATSRGAVRPHKIKLVILGGNNAYLRVAETHYDINLSYLLLAQRLIVQDKAPLCFVSA